MNLQPKVTNYTNEVVFLARGHAEFGKTVTIKGDYIPKNSAGKKIVPAGMRLGMDSAGYGRPATRMAFAYTDFDCSNANSDFRLTANQPYTPGNSITCVLVDPSAASSPLAVSVSGSAITVSLATNSSSTIVSTANEVIAAINADPDANDLVTASLASGSTGAGVVEAKTVQTLAGGTDGFASKTIDCTNANSDFKVTANVAGEAGNDLQIKLTVSGNSTALSVSYDDGLIDVAVATNSGGTATSTAAQVIAAINADYEASALVTAALVTGSTGAGVVEAKPAANLTYGGSGVAAIGLVPHELDVTESDATCAPVIGGIIKESALPITIATAGDHPWTAAQRTELKDAGRFVFEA